MFNRLGRATACGPALAASNRHCIRQTVSLVLGPLLITSGLLVTLPVQAVGETNLASVSYTGTAGSRGSTGASLSADGRYVAFESTSNDLVRNDRNRATDIFVYDRQTSETTRVSVDSLGHEANGDSGGPSLSPDGRFIAFTSLANNLVTDDLNGRRDIFVHDRQTRATTRINLDAPSIDNAMLTFPNAPVLSHAAHFVAFEAFDGSYSGNIPLRQLFVHDRIRHQTMRVSVDPSGNAGNGDSLGASLSNNGRCVAFDSTASNLVTSDTNGTPDVFVHDLQSHRTTRVSVDSAGHQGNAFSWKPHLSADGRLVAFVSSAELVPGYEGARYDVFVHDRLTRETTLASIDLVGGARIWDAWDPRLSADGRFVTFWSWDSTFVSDDINNEPDVFIYDRQTHQTTRASINSTRDQNPYVRAYLAAPVSADGRFVAFNAFAALDPSYSAVFVRDRLLDRSATADLGITQTAEPAQFVPLSPLTYTLTAVNHGPDAATDVTVNDRPALLSGTVLSVTPSQGSCSQGAPFVCYLGMLAPGASSTITVTLQPRWRDTVSLWNTAQISAAPVDGNTANNQSTLRTNVAP